MPKDKERSRRRRRGEEAVGGPRRVFTVDEVDAMIPWLESLFGQLLRLRDELARDYGELASEGAAPDRSSMPDDPALRRRREDFDQRAEVFATTLDVIQDTGGVIKDVDEGLVDFLGRVGGNDVWLCWRFGEKRVAYYHGLDEGAAARKPIPGRDEPVATDWN